LESLNDVVGKITGVPQRETVPDAVVRAADQVELVDMTPEALRRRMAHGNIYPPEKIDAALTNYFRPGNLDALRELALLWLAESVGGTYHQVVGDNIAEALLEFARVENATQLVLGASRRSWPLALLTGPGIGARTIRGSGDIDVHIVTHSQMGRGRGLPQARGGITLRRRIAGYLLAVALLPLLTVVLASLRGSLNLTTDVLAFFVA